MPNDDKVPARLVDRLLDQSNETAKNTAKELSNLENIVATLVTNISTSPNTADVHKIVESMHTIIENEAEVKLEGISTSVKDLTKELKLFTKTISESQSKIKWIAGIVIVVVGLAGLGVTYLTGVSEKTIKANTSVQILELDKKYEAQILQRDKEFNRLLKKIGK